MESFGKVLLILTVFLGALSMDVKGARLLKEKDEVEQPQTFGVFASPGLGGSFPNPGLGGSFPGPGLGGSFPSPGLGGSFPSPGLGGSFPSPGLGGSFPSSGLGGSFPSPGVGLGPSTFCLFPGAQCAPAKASKTIGQNLAGSP